MKIKLYTIVIGLLMVALQSNAQNVGIGIATPANRLHVDGLQNGDALGYFNQNGTASGSHAVKGNGPFGPTRGYLGVQGNTAFDGSTWNLLGYEIGVLGISEGASSTDNYGVMGLSNYIGVYGQSNNSIGTFGQSAASTSFGIYGYNSNASGTAIIGTGNNIGASYLTGGSGGAFTGNPAGAVAMAKAATGTGVIAAGNNQGWWNLTVGSGVAGNGEYGLYGRSGSATGAGVIGQNASTGWTGDFQGPMRAGVSTLDRHDFWGWWQSGSASDNHRVSPNTGFWGYVGDATYYWYYMYSSNFVNMSQRALKRNIVPTSQNKMLQDVIMSDLDRMNPSFYKYIGETDRMESGNEAKFRPNMHLGLILDETPDYLQDNAMSGIDIYSIGVMGLAAAKYNREEIKLLKKNVQDFGLSSLQGKEVFVPFNDEFAKADKISIPIVTVSALQSAHLYIRKISAEGFIVCSDESVECDFNWIAMSKVNSKKALSLAEIESTKQEHSLVVSEADKAAIQSWRETEKAHTEKMNALAPPAVISPSVASAQNSTDNISLNAEKE